MKPNFNVVFIIIAALLLTLTFSCKKDPAVFLPSISTVEASNITNESVTSGGVISNDGGSEILYRGVCWNTSSNPTIENNKTSDGKGVGSYSSEIKGLTSGETYYLRAYATNSVGIAYGNQTQFSTESRQPGKFITASTGGTIITYESIKLVIPPNALTRDGIVSVGRTGNEPTTFPNNRLLVYGTPISLKLPSDTLYKPLILSFPVTQEITDSSTYSIFAFDGSSYVPLKYNIRDKVVTVEVEFNKSLSAGVSTKNVAGTIVIMGAVMAQNLDILFGGMGLKEASISNGKLNFLQINSQQINSRTKILLMIHGWCSWPSTWEYFLNRIFLELNRLNYDKFWTFGYNSSKPIDENGEILKNLISQYSNGATIDIVAHSMGGLVARSMIEKQNGEVYVYRLVTLGTPHQGSPLAALRDVIGKIVGSGSVLAQAIYNYTTRGFSDLNIGSALIESLSSLTKPKIPYYTIACLNGMSSPFISGDNDGLVSVVSALGAGGAEKPMNNIKIPVFLAHLDMRENEDIYQQVKNFLLKNKPSVITSPINIITHTSASIGGDISNDGGYPVTERGIYWSDHPAPEANGNKIQIGSGPGLFSYNLKSLLPSTKYYVKAYAKNALGVSYGELMSFTTLSAPPNSIFVNSTPPGATVYLNSTDMQAVTPFTFTNVNSGSHQIRVYKYGYNEYIKTINLLSGSSVTVDANLGNPLPPLPYFTITNPKNNSNLTHNVLTVSGNIVLRAANGTTTPFYGNTAILTINEVDQEIYVNNGSFSQEVLIKSGQNKLRLRANSPNGDTGTSDEIVFFGNFSTQDIQILLRWNNGISADPKDVDLHVYDSYNRHTYWLCTSKYSSHTNYYNAISNMIPESNLDFDNTIGYGPETFSLNKSTNTTYTVRVQFYAGHRSNNPTDANIQIILGGSILKTYGPYRFKNSYDNTYYDDPDCWWNVISFSYVNGVFTVINNIPVIPNNAINESNEKFHIK